MSNKEITTVLDVEMAFICRFLKHCEDEWIGIDTADLERFLMDVVTYDSSNDPIVIRDEMIKTMKDIIENDKKIIRLLKDEVTLCEMMLKAKKED